MESNKLQTTLFDSHWNIWNSMSFHVRNDGSLVEIDTKFHDYSMSFIQVLLVFHAQTWHGFWKSSSHGISRAFAKKMMGFPSDLVSFLTKLPSKRHEKIRVTLFTGFLTNKSFSLHKNRIRNKSFGEICVKKLD